jgi:hypothetical protein
MPWMYVDAAGRETEYSEEEYPEARRHILRAYGLMGTWYRFQHLDLTMHDDGVRLCVACAGQLVLAPDQLCPSCQSVGFLVGQRFHLADHYPLRRDGDVTDDQRFHTTIDDNHLVVHTCRPCGWMYEVGPEDDDHAILDRHWATHVDPMLWPWLVHIGDVVVLVGSTTQVEASPYRAESVNGAARTEILQAYGQGLDLGPFLHAWHLPLAGGSRGELTRYDIRWEDSGLPVTR